MPVREIADRMLATYPQDVGVDRGLLARAIEACHDCAAACTQCADDCLSERGHVEEMAKCIRLDLDCADICGATARVLGRQTEYDAEVTRAVLRACVTACRSCGDECARHGDAGMEHCAVCAGACRACERACDDVLAAIA